MACITMECGICNTCSVACVAMEQGISSDTASISYGVGQLATLHRLCLPQQGYGDVAGITMGVGS